MLSPLDADLVRRDPALPGLAIVLDPEAFVGALRRSLPDVDLGAACITYVKYKPRTVCLIGYRLAVAGTVVDVYAKAYGANAAEKLQKAYEQPGQPGALGQGRIPLDDCQVVVSAFPNDAKVRALPSLVEAETRFRLLRKLFPDRPTLWMGTVQGLVYKPERRYVARLLTEDRPQAVLKFYTQPGYFEVVQRHRKPYEARAPLRLASRLGESDRRAALAFEWLPGRLLSEAILEPQFDAHALVTVGAAIAQLHTQAPEGLRRLTPETGAGALLSEADMLGLVCPHLAQWAEALAQRIAAHLVNRPPVFRLIHGDFHARQVLLNGDTAAILDLDRAGCADPMIDLGLFAAHLEREVIRGHLPASRVEPLVQALLEGYTAASRQPVADQIQLYTAAELLRLAPRFFRYREPDWPERIEASLGRVEMILALTPGPDHASSYRPFKPTKAPKIFVTDPFGAADDPAMSFLAQALDPLEVQRQFEDGLPSLTAGNKPFQLRAIRVVRHKPGRRCLIEYDIERREAEAITLIGKVRARGPDHSTHHLVVSLWNAGFGADSPDGIGVPQPIGIIPKFQMWLQYKVPGLSATRLLAQPGGVELARRIAEAIHKLHQAGIPSTRRHTMGDELRILHERLMLVARLKPQWLHRLERILEACDRLGATTPEPIFRGVHRDFYADHIIVDGPRLYLVDFDLYGEGDPGLDIGNFVAHLTEQSLRTLGDPNALRDREQALEERFVELAGEATRVAVRAYTILTLARHIYLSTQFTERRPFTEGLLQLCEQRLGIML